MPALIAYLLSVGIFFGGGYLGLNLLAGNFESPPQISRVDAGQKTEGKRKVNRLSLQTKSLETPQASQDEVSVRTGAPGDEVVVQPPLVSPPSQPELSTVSESLSQAARITPPVIDPAPQEAAPPAHMDQGTPDNDSDQIASKAAFAAADSNDAVRPLDQSPKAKTTQSVKNARLDLRAMSKSLSPLMTRREASTSRTTKRKKPALVTMVLQTIEYPDGRREQRLVNRRQAQLAE